MAAIITRTGKGAAITQSENDSNLDSLCGINEPQTGTTYTIDAADQNSTIEFSNAAPVVATLTLISTIIAANDTSDFQATLKNIGAGVVTVTPTTNTFDDGSVTKILAQYEWMTIQTDSTQVLWNVIGSSDASKVDGLDASQFLRSDANDSASGNLTLSGSNTHSGTTNTFSGTTNLFSGATVNLNPTNLQIAGVNMTSSAAELNRSDITTEGTVEASKVVTADSNANVNFPDGSAIGDVNGNEVIIVATTASAVNEITVIPSATGNAPAIESTGDDINIDLDLRGKGEGYVTSDGGPAAVVQGALAVLLEPVTLVNASASASGTIDMSVVYAAAVNAGAKAYMVNAKGHCEGASGGGATDSVVSSGTIKRTGGTITTLLGQATEDTNTSKVDLKAEWASTAVVAAGTNGDVDWTSFGAAGGASFTTSITLNLVGYYV